MAEFFLELFSEEIPPKLQKNTRDFLLENFQKLFEEKNLKFKNSKSYSKFFISPYIQMEFYKFP